MIEIAKKIIEEIDRIDSTTSDAYNNIILALKKLPRLPVFTQRIGCPVEVFRSVTSFEDVFFDSKGRIAHPPSEYVKSFARCNMPKQSMFYSSENRPVSYLELVDYWTKNGEIGNKLYVTTGRWKTAKPFVTLVITFPSPQKWISEYDKYHGEALIKNFEDQSEEIMAYSFFIFEFLSEKFRTSAKENLHTYMTTTAYCNLVLDCMPNIDAISFPSVPSVNEGLNIVFRSSFVDCEGLQLIDAVRSVLTISSNEEGKHHFVETSRILSRPLNKGDEEIIWIIG